MKKNMKKVLYLGTDSSSFSSEPDLLHYPVIRLVPKSLDDEHLVFCFSKIKAFSHFFFTSKNAVDLFFAACSHFCLPAEDLLQEKCVSIGPVTSKALEIRGVKPLWEAAIHTQEGIIEDMQKYSWKDSYILYPRSSLARPLMAEYLSNQSIVFEALDLYDTVLQAEVPIPDLQSIKEIVFTSPSTVKGFFQIFKKIPDGVKVSFQGAITEKAFNDVN